MLKGMFTRFGSQYRDACTAVIKFSFRDSDDTWVRVNTGTGNAGRDGNHPDISVADAGTGLATLTYPKCRQICVESTSIDALASTAASQRVVHHGAGTVAQAAAGSLPLYIYQYDGTNGITLADPVDGAILTVKIYVGK